MRLLLAAALLTGGSTMAVEQKKPPPVRPADLLDEAEKLLRQRRPEPAIEILRRLLRRFPGAAEAERGRRLLARTGHGSNFRVVFRKRRSLHRLDLREEDLVARIETGAVDLAAFFRQTYGAPRMPIAFEVIVFDSRARYRAASPRSGRRSRIAFLAAGKAKGKGEEKRRPALRARIEVFLDARISDRRDAVAVMLKETLRQVAALLLRAHTRSALPDALRVGLGEYLAVRLVPRKLTGLSQTLEGVSGSFAREALARIAAPKDLRAFLSSRDPHGKVPPAVAAQWDGLAYAIYDTVLNAPLDRRGNGRVEKGAGRGVDRLLRVRALQEVLRRLERDPVRPAAGKKKAAAGVRLFETALEAHLGVSLERFHRALLEHARGYPPLEPDFEGIAE